MFPYLQPFIKHVMRQCVTSCPVYSKEYLEMNYFIKNQKSQEGAAHTVIIYGGLIHDNLG